MKMRDRELAGRGEERQRGGRKEEGEREVGRPRLILLARMAFDILLHTTTSAYYYCHCGMILYQLFITVTAAAGGGTDWKPSTVEALRHGARIGTPAMDRIIAMQGRGGEVGVIGGGGGGGGGRKPVRRGEVC